MERAKVVHVKDDKYKDQGVYIGRPSKWGNPFSHLPGTLALYRVGSRAEAIEAYREWLNDNPELRATVGELKGEVLKCWCSPLPCHGDVLADLAEGGGDEK